VCRTRDKGTASRRWPVARIRGALHLAANAPGAGSAISVCTPIAIGRPPKVIAPTSSAIISA